MLILFYKKNIFPSDYLHRMCRTQKRRRCQWHCCGMNMCRSCSRARIWWSIWQGRTTASQCDSK